MIPMGERRQTAWGVGLLGLVILGIIEEIQHHGQLPLHGCVVPAVTLLLVHEQRDVGPFRDQLLQLLDMHHVDRGYEGFDRKLELLGANLRRERELSPVIP